MNDNIKEKRERFIFRFSLAVSLLSFIAVFFLTGMQTYVRWFINQNFLVVGGSQLEVFTASAFVFALALAVVHRPERRTPGTAEHPHIAD